MDRMTRRSVDAIDVATCVLMTHYDKGIYG